MLKRSVVLRPKRLKIPSFDYKLLILFALFLCGLIIGVAAAKKSDSTFSKDLALFLENLSSTRSKAGFFNCFCSSVLTSAFLPCLCFFFGLCAIGAPLIFMLPATAGIFFGAVTGHYYVSYGYSGLGYVALVLLPAAAVVIGTLIKCCAESTKMSVDMLAAAVRAGVKEGSDKENPLKKYCIQYLIFALPVLLAALLYTIGCKLFSGLFSFI